MKRILQKLSKGSVLVYTIILLFILLTVSIGMMSASVRNLKSVSSGDHSINAFGVADSGSEAVLAKIKRASGTTIDTIADIDCSDPSLAKISSGLFNGSYSVTFLDKDEKTLTCSDKISDVTSIKSVGSYADTARAVEVAVAAGGCDADNKGGVVIVDEKNDSGHPDWDAIDDFMNDHGPIVGYRCDVPAGGGGGSIVIESLFGGVSDFRRSTLIFAYTVPSTSFAAGVSGSFLCTQGNGCVHYTGSSLPCSNGWRIYGMCSK